MGLRGQHRWWGWGQLGLYIQVKGGSGFKAMRVGKNEHVLSTYCVPVTFHMLPRSGYTTAPGGFSSPLCREGSRCQDRRPIGVNQTYFPPQT